MAEVKNLHTADRCHSLYCWGILCKSQRLKQAFLTAGYFITCFTPERSCYTSIVYPLLLTKRNKERRQSGREAAADPDGLRPWHFVCFYNFGVFTFHTPLVPSALSSSVSFVCHIIFQLGCPRTRCLCCYIAWSELKALDSMSSVFDKGMGLL